MKEGLRELEEYGNMIGKNNLGVHGVRKHIRLDYTFILTNLYVYILRQGRRLHIQLLHVFRKKQKNKKKTIARKTVHDAW